MDGNYRLCFAPLISNTSKTKPELNTIFMLTKITFLFGIELYKKASRLSREFVIAATSLFVDGSPFL